MTVSESQTTSSANIDLFEKRAAAGESVENLVREVLEESGDLSLIVAIERGAQQQRIADANRQAVTGTAILIVAGGMAAAFASPRLFAGAMFGGVLLAIGLIRRLMAALRPIKVSLPEDQDVNRQQSPTLLPKETPDQFILRTLTLSCARRLRVAKVICLIGCVFVVSIPMMAALYVFTHWHTRRMKRQVRELLTASSEQLVWMHGQMVTRASVTFGVLHLHTINSFGDKRTIVAGFFPGDLLPVMERFQLLYPEVLVGNTSENRALYAGGTRVASCC